MNVQIIQRFYRDHIKVHNIHKCNICHCNFSDNNSLKCVHSKCEDGKLCLDCYKRTDGPEKCFICLNTTRWIFKCVKCKEYNGNTKFNMRCSECFKEDYPDRYKIVIGYVPSPKMLPHTKDSLHEIISKHVVPDNHFLIYSLKHMFKTSGILDKQQFDEWISCMIKLGFRGISANVGNELGKNIYLNKNGDDIWKSIENKNLYKVQHFISGFILDSWNIDGSILGLGLCYYGNMGYLPKMDQKEFYCEILNFMKKPSSNNIWYNNSYSLFKQ